MAQTLNVYLVVKFTGSSMYFEADKLKLCSDHLTAYFKDTIDKTRFNDVKVITTGKQSDVTDDDFVCYMLTSAADSIVKGKTQDALGLSGSTFWSKTDKACISEVYMRKIVQGGDPRGNATADADWVVANCIFHELMHNLLDAEPPATTLVHNLPGGSIARNTDLKPLAYNDRPSKADNNAVNKGFTAKPHGRAQYKTDMPTS